MDRARFLLSALLLCTSALAATSTATVPLNATTVNSCVSDTSNGTPTIDLFPSYQAGNIPSGSQGLVSVSVYCNKGTTISSRTLTGTTSTSTPNAHVTAPLTQFSPGTTDVLNAESWFTVGATAPVGSGLYIGGVRSVTTVNGGWPSVPQFNASSGFYTGNVTLTITF